MPNAAPSGRRGSLAIGSSRVDLIQEAAPCQFQIDASRIEVPGGGGGGRIQVTGIAGCGWTARAVEPWITVVRGAAGNGSDSVELSIAANDGPARQGTVAVAGHSVTVVQDAASAPAPSPAPGPAPGPPAPPAPAPPAPTPPAPTPPAPTPPAPTPPAPTPPAPAPPPPPAPPTGPVELEGTVSSVRGACPELTFVVAGTSVYTDGSTLYRRGNCRHVEAGTRVVVLGRRQPDGRVLAEQVDLDRE